MTYKKSNNENNKVTYMKTTPKKKNSKTYFIRHGGASIDDA